MTNGTNDQGLKITIDLDKGIRDIISNVRIINCLHSENILTLRELCAQSAGYLIRIPNFGRKSLKEVEENLAEYNLSLSHIYTLYKVDVEVSQPNKNDSFEKYKNSIINQFHKDAKVIGHLPIVDQIAKLKLIHEVMLVIDKPV